MYLATLQIDFLWSGFYKIVQQRLYIQSKNPYFSMDLSRIPTYSLKIQKLWSIVLLKNVSWDLTVTMCILIFFFFPPNISSLIARVTVSTPHGYLYVFIQAILFSDHLTSEFGPNPHIPTTGYKVWLEWVRPIRCKEIFSWVFREMFLLCSAGYNKKETFFLLC